MRLLWAVLGLLASAGVVGADAPIRVIDDRGRAVTLGAPSTRIVTLAPSLAALVESAGAIDRLVGVSNSSQDTHGAAHLPIVAGPGRVDLEHLTALRPDLVLAWASGNPARAIARLQERGVAVYLSEPRRLEDLARAVRAIGRLAGTQSVAEAAAREFEGSVAAITGVAAVRGGSARVFIEISDEPIMTVNGEHLISDLVQRCGGRNVFADSRVLVPRIGLEDLVRAAPDLILTSAALDDVRVARRWAERRSMLAAVREGRVMRVEPSRLHLQSLGVIEALRAICDGLRNPLRPAIAMNTARSAGATL
jgi:iron complex transport system substrate-binding protein